MSRFIQIRTAYIDGAKVEKLYYVDVDSILYVSHATNVREPYVDIHLKDCSTITLRSTLPGTALDFIYECIGAKIVDEYGSTIADLHNPPDTEFGRARDAKIQEIKPSKKDN